MTSRTKFGPEDGIPASELFKELSELAGKLHGKTCEQLADEDAKKEDDEEMDPIVELHYDMKRTMRELLRESLGGKTAHQVITDASETPEATARLFGNTRIPRDQAEEFSERMRRMLEAP